ncbi:MAG TPA: protein-L-isoaspartate(D-aspartate) O-methyltransferase [Methylovirgula sp.]|nr:protein-L-isoaspartate(D-aspartate) O-methyltransferase [Methylovirgula sp.]
MSERAGNVVSAATVKALQEIDAASARAEEKAAFLLRLRASGIRDLDLLRALEKVPREMFVPHRLVDLARRDLALPIGCGQTLTEPSLVARMIEALALTRQHRVLEIGTGSGYATAILAEIAGEVVSIERFQTLAIAARLRLQRLGKTNATVIFADGLAMPAEAGPFDRILVHGSLDEVPPRLVDLLGEHGRLVMARPERGQPWRQTLIEVHAGQGLVAAELCACRLQALLPGTARVL